MHYDLALRQNTSVDIERHAATLTDLLHGIIINN